MNTQVTLAASVQLPVRHVVLQYLKTKDGQPVVVGCSPVSEIAMARALGLPGGQPKQVDAPQMSDVDAAAMMMKLAPEMIEGGTFLLGPDGEELRPAFSWKDPAPPHSIPGRYLRDEEQLALMQALMELGGYLGGAAEDAGFPAGGAGGGDGDGAVGGGTL